MLFNLPSSSDAAIFRSTLARALGIACVDDAIVWYDGSDIMIYYDIYIYIYIYIYIIYGTVLFMSYKVIRHLCADTTSRFIIATIQRFSGGWMCMWTPEAFPGPNLEERIRAIQLSSYPNLLMVLCAYYCLQTTNCNWQIKLKFPQKYRLNKFDLYTN